MFGSWIDFLAILTLSAYQMHVTPYQMVIVSVANLLPGILLTLPIGRFCDKNNVASILGISLLFRVCATVGLVLVDSFAGFILFISLRSAFNAVSIPAINVISSRLVAADETTRHYSILNLIANTAKILAPSIGVVASSLAGEKIALLFSAGLTGVAFFVMVGLKVPAQVILTTPVEKIQRKLREYWQDRNKEVSFLLWCVAAYSFFIFMTNNHLPLVLSQLHFDKTVLGLLISCSGAGNIALGIFKATRSKNNTSLSVRHIIYSAAGAAVCFCFIGITLSLATDFAIITTGILFFFLGASTASFSISSNVFIVRNFPAKIASLSSMTQAIQNFMALLAPILGAYLLAQYGPMILYFSAGVFGIFCFFILTLKTIPAIHSKSKLAKIK
jgi:MFS family permease